jgi:hypothetical protein
MASSPRTKIRMAWKRMEREGVSSPVIGHSIIWRGVLSGSDLLPSRPPRYNITFVHCTVLPHIGKGSIA